MWSNFDVVILILTPLQFHKMLNLMVILFTIKKFGFRISSMRKQISMLLQKIFIPSVLQGLHSGKKAQKMQQCTCVRVIFYFSKECRKEYIPPFIYYIFTKSCNFFVMSFAYFSKVLTFYRRIIAKQYVEKKRFK